MSNWVKYYLSVLLGQNVLPKGRKHLHQYSHFRSEGTKAELNSTDVRLKARIQFQD